jgi:hypothetical protein
LYNCCCATGCRCQTCFTRDRDPRCPRRHTTQISAIIAYDLKVIELDGSASKCRLQVDIRNKLLKAMEAGMAVEPLEAPATLLEIQSGVCQALNDMAALVDDTSGLQSLYQQWVQPQMQEKPTVLQVPQQVRPGRAWLAIARTAHPAQR